MSETLEVAIVQLNSSDSPEKSFQQIYELVNKIDRNVDLISFPENALYINVNSKSPEIKFDLSEPYFKKLEEFADTKGTAIHLGSVRYWDGQNCYNSTLWCNPGSEFQPVYNKIHLFDVDVEGQKPMRESDGYSHGSEPNIVEYKGWKFGLSICYDLRFSELYKFYSENQVDALLVPSAFLVPTGKAHWEVLLRARAIENQSYVLAAAQVGEHVSVNGGSRNTFGHSLCIDPWGKILAEASGDLPEVIYGTLEKAKIHKTKAQIPMANHRRL